jgi:hypothetical protein
MFKQFVTLGVVGLLSLATIGCNEEESSNPTGPTGGGGGGGSSWDADLNGTYDYYGTGDVADLSGEPVGTDYLVVSEESWVQDGSEMLVSDAGPFYAKDGIIGSKLGGIDTPLYSYLVEDGVLYWNGTSKDGTVDKTSPNTLVYKKK